MAGEQSMVERRQRVTNCGVLFLAGFCAGGVLAGGLWAMLPPPIIVALLSAAALADVPAPASQRDDAVVA